MSSNTLSRALIGSALTTAATTAAALVLSARDTGHAAAALNATSHIVWGDKVGHFDEADYQHTVVGGALNAGAVALWSTIHALFPKPNSTFAKLRNAALVAAAAYVTDYYIVPKRLTPGFEKRLSKTSLLGMYAALAASLVLSDAAALQTK
jgi:hypothetical protein